MDNSTLYIKAHLLAGAKISFTEKTKAILSKSNSNLLNNYTDNHHSNQWVFVKLSNKSRVRLTVSNNALFELDLRNVELKNFSVLNSQTKEIIADNVFIEEALVHAPEQLFLGLYEYCDSKCKFCPLTYRKEQVHYSLDNIFKDISDNLDKNFSSVGITTAIPPNMTKEEVGDELAFVISKIVEKIGTCIPLGVSTKCPTMETLEKLKSAGASEIRLNIEIYNPDLAHKLMPNKKIDNILDSIENACKVFGRGKVSSNMILGIGESDDDIIKGIDALASMGAIATLYPYDPIDNIELNGKFEIPTSDRLLYLAQIHKEILDKYQLDTNGLKTMCPGCAASHIFPGKDL